MAWACLLACWFGDESQHSVAPHCWQVRRWTHVAWIFTHSWHSRRFSCLTLPIAVIWEHAAGMRTSVSYPSVSDGIWPELPYEAWKDTYATLHMWTQIVGKVALAQAAPLNHSWGIAMQVTPLQMKKLGFLRVRPLEGGLRAWIEEGLPLVDRVVRESPAARA